MNRANRYKCLLALLLLPSLLPLAAQERRNPASEKGWYGGIVGGVPFGASTFSSFGADKTRAGYDPGVYGGYRFNPVLSAEVSLKWGKTALSSRECCIASGYWLGADGSRYLAPAAGMEGWLWKTWDANRYHLSRAESRGNQNQQYSVSTK